MSKIKMRCMTCGKWFQSANAKEVTCPDCVQKARKEKLATKNVPPILNKPTGPIGQGVNSPARPPAPPPKPKPVQSGTTHWLDTLDDVKVGQPDQPVRPKSPPPSAPRDTRGGQSGLRGPATGPGHLRENRSPGNYREGRGPGAYREQDYRSPNNYRVIGGSGLPGTNLGQRPRQPMEGGFGYGPRPEKTPYPAGSRERGPSSQKPPRSKTGTSKPAVRPKPKREKILPPPPFTPTPEQIAQAEERYLVLAVPAEFDGIRTQISKELGIPKKAVKKIIKDLRSRQNIPSWWELQTYKGDSEELERIKAVYEPLLPVPPVGVHKKIAEELSLKPGIVYQAIKKIRQEMSLPQYNDPELHKLEQDASPQTHEQLSPVEEPSATQTETVPVTTESATANDVTEA